MQKNPILERIRKNVVKNVLKALEERGLTPGLVVGSSMGSLIAAAWAAGMPIPEMTQRGLAARRRDIFQVAHVDMALKRIRSPAVYRREPLDELISSLVGDRTFADLHRPLLTNTVELNSGMQVFWGLPGLRQARVADAFFASCALPGIFPPREIEGRWYVDGAVTENMPVQIAAAQGAGPVFTGAPHVQTRSASRHGRRNGSSKLPLHQTTTDGRTMPRRRSTMTRRSSGARKTSFTYTGVCSRK